MVVFADVGNERKRGDSTRQCAEKSLFPSQKESTDPCGWYFLFSFNFRDSKKTYSQNMGAIEIWVDKETGVNYLYRQSGYSGGMTVLLDKDGKPVITPIIN